jgi:hypothetical protein
LRKSVEGEIAKLVKAGIDGGLIKRFLKEISEEDEC